MKRAPVTVEDESGVGVARVVSHSIDFNRQVAAAVAAPLPLGLGVIGQSSTASRTIRRNHGAKANVCCRRERRPWRRWHTVKKGGVNTRKLVHKLSEAADIWRGRLAVVSRQL